MSENTEILALEIDQHLNRHQGFAIYKLPGNDYGLMLQNSNSSAKIKSLTDIDTVNGFIIAPFDLQKFPIVTISPDISAHGIDDILTKLKATPLEESVVSEHYQTTDMTRESYDRALQSMVKLMETTELRKVVLARSEKAKKPASIGRVFIRACEENPNFFVYLCSSPQCGTWLGATPEIFLRKRENHFRTIALAGTKPTEEKLAWSQKNIEEQRYVHDYIFHKISAFSSNINIEPATTLKAGGVEHLCSIFDFETNATLGEISSQLHPTPAVCGEPKELAMNALGQFEETNRLYYSGIVGVKNSVNADLFVNLRCMTCDTFSSTLFAGGGLLRQSEANAEWRETELKMQTLLRIINENNLD